MNTLRIAIVLLFGLPIGFALTAMVCVLTSILWLIFLPWKLFDYIFDKRNPSLHTFEELIFACYGLGGVCTLIPLMLLSDEPID